MAAGERSRRDPRQDADPPSAPKGATATGVQAAGVRALAARAVAFYFRAPVKAFFRGRIDYMGYVRAIHPPGQAGSAWSWKTMTPALLAHAVRRHGWAFLPNQVLPPLLANTLVGAVLYTSYLQTLSAVHPPSSHSTKRIYLPPAVSHTVAAGFLAGSVQSLFAAPFDALQVRFRTSDLLEGRYKSMWCYAGHKLRSIGVRGIFAGWGLSLLKDSVGAAAFFGTFEVVKSHAYYEFVTQLYGRRTSLVSESAPDATGKAVILPHYALEPMFLLLAGVSASVAAQLVQHPLSELQAVHYNRLESLDLRAQEKPPTLRRYYHAYQETLRQCKKLAQPGGWRRFLYRDFWPSTIRQVPSTSAGLIAFELVRRKYAFESDEVRISKDGFDILPS